LRALAADGKRQPPTTADERAHNEVARVVQIRGSMTLGMAIKDQACAGPWNLISKGGRKGLPPDMNRNGACPYGPRFARSLAAHFQESVLPRLRFINKGRGGYHTRAFNAILPDVLSKLPDDATPTLIRIDLSVNDNFILFWHDTANHEAWLEQILMQVKAMLLYLLEHHPTKALLLVDGYPGSRLYGARTVPSQMAAVYVGAAAELGVPLVQVARVLRDANADAMWPSKDCEPPIPNCLMIQAHPQVPTHTVLSDAVFYSVLALAQKGGCAGPDDRSAAEWYSSPASVPLRALVCIKTESYYSAGTHFAARVPPRRRPGVLDRSWRLYEDRGGKPGWITSGPVGATIHFPLQLGENPRVVVSFLKGYSEALGVVEMQLLGLPSQGSTRVRSRDESALATIAHEIYLDDSQTSPIRLAPHTNVTLSATLVCERPACDCTRGAKMDAEKPGCKFKLLAVGACARA
jgi:hypothetical protein